MQRKNRRPRDASLNPSSLPYYALGCVGVGSSLFHASLKTTAQFGVCLLFPFYGSLGRIDADDRDDMRPSLDHVESLLD